MTEPPARRAGTAGAYVFVAALALAFVSIAHSWKVLGVLSASVVLAVAWTTAARYRHEHGRERPPDTARPWRDGK